MPIPPSAGQGPTTALPSFAPLPPRAAKPVLVSIGLPEESGGGVTGGAGGMEGAVVCRSRDCAGPAGECGAGGHASESGEGGALVTLCGLWQTEKCGEEGSDGASCELRLACPIGTAAGGTLRLSAADTHVTPYSGEVFERLFTEDGGVRDAAIAAPAECSRTNTTSGDTADTAAGAGSGVRDGAAIAKCGDVGGA